jgi:transcription antitermination factor NusG
VVASFLNAMGKEEFFPRYKCRRQWSDRIRVVEFPLFDGYVFFRSEPGRTSEVLGAPGLVHIVGFGNGPEAVPDAEIVAVRRLVDSGLLASPCPYLKEGDRVRIRSGALKGLEGILIETKNQFRLVLTVDLLKKSVAVEVDAETVEALR